MTQGSPSFSPAPPSKPPYIWAVVILVLIGAVVVLGVLWLHPESDPKDVMGQVSKGLAPTIAAVLAYMKSQETHLSVNSRLDAFMSEHAKVAHAEGVAQGKAAESDRRHIEAGVAAEGVERHVVVHAAPEVRAPAVSTADKKTVVKLADQISQAADAAHKTCDEIDKADETAAKVVEKVQENKKP